MKMWRTRILTYLIDVLINMIPDEDEELYDIITSEEEYYMMSKVGWDYEEASEKLEKFNGKYNL